MTVRHRAVMADRQSFGERYRAGWHRIGLLWNRVLGTVLVVLGGYGLLLSLGSGTFSLKTHWPTFVAVGGLWLLALWFFKARDVVVEPVDGEDALGDVIEIDRRLGVVFARICGTLFALGGSWALVEVVKLPGYSFGIYWPVFVMSGLLFLGAWACFRSRTGLMDKLSDGPADPPPEPPR